MNIELITAVAIGIGLSASAGVGNPVVATGENVAAIGTSLLSLIIPFFVVAGILLMMIFIFTRFRKRPGIEQIN